MATKKKAAQDAAAAEAETMFSKDQLLAAEHFRGRQDILSALLSPHKTYTVKTVEQMIKRYMKGQVK